MTHVENLDLDSSLQGDIVPLSPPTPEERLQASRTALQMWVKKTYGHDDAAADAPPHSEFDSTEPGWLSILADSLSDIPAATIAVRWAKRWWAHHPWRATADFASVAARELVRPVALKHPWMLVGGAVLAGGVLVRLRPWRWISGGALLAGFLPRFDLGSILHTVTSVLTDWQAKPDPEENSEESQETLSSQEQMAA